MDPSDPALPVAGTGALSAVRRSRTSRWRALTLGVVHVVVALHVAHFLVAGRTLSPVEPSEAMYTLELGEVNAGFLFLLAALLATLVFGRFFCGWGCHLVALQDLCGWLMKRLGVRPRPLRSRWLALAPLGLALYMFVWPAVRRTWYGEAAQFAGFSNRLLTTDFWKTFPGPIIAVLTFAVCGFAAVYVLGAKGFCTYGCPYGALFGIADRLALGRIVVSDACEGCGHCTATCTSNVRVHDEVRRFGRVVDPGCMKCMDCVSVCPKGALRFAFVTPWSRVRRGAGGAAAHAGGRPSLASELLLALVFVGALPAFRGLYDGPPLLLAAGLAGITAFAALQSARLLRRPTVKLQSLSLKLAGRMTRTGWVVGLLGAVWLGLTVHSGYVQWHRQWGRHWLSRTEGRIAEVLGGAPGLARPGSEHLRARDRAWHHFSQARRWGLLPVAEVELGLAWTHLLRGETAAGEAGLRRVIELAPADPRPHDYLIELLAGQGRLAPALDAALGKAERVGPTGPDEFRIAGLVAAAGDLPRAAEHYARALGLGPVTAPLRYNYGATLRRLGRAAQAVEQLAAAAALDPADEQIRTELDLARAEAAP